MEYNIYIVIAAAAIVSLDIFVRLCIGHRRRDWFYKTLLQTQQGISAGAQRAGTTRPAVDESLSQALLTFFRESFTSRQVLTVLASSPSGMGGKELEVKVAENIAQKWNREIAVNAIRRVIMILMAADLISCQSGNFTLTALGWKLFEKASAPSNEAAANNGARSLVPAC